MLASAARALLSTAAPAGEGAALSVLIFHRVLEAPDPLQPGEPTVQQFTALMQWVRDTFTVLPLDRAVDDLEAGRLPRRALAISFDDGYADNHDLAAPVLRQLGLPATFFVATGFLDGGTMFNDLVLAAVRAAPGPSFDLSSLGLGVHAVDTDDARRAALRALLPQVKVLPPEQRDGVVHAILQAAGVAPPPPPMMRSAQVAALHGAGFGIGGHTVWHPILARQTDEVARTEILAGKRRLEALCGAPISLFAYPNGRPGDDYSAATVRLVRDCGFRAAVTTSAGAARRGDDPFQIPRFTPWSSQAARFAALMWRNVARTRPQTVAA